MRRGGRGKISEEERMVVQEEEVEVEGYAKEKKEEMEEGEKVEEVEG